METTKAGELSLFKAGPIDNLKCSFCPEAITEGKVFLETVINGKPRRIHWDCLIKGIRSVVESRDRRGVSNDLA